MVGGLTSGSQFLNVIHFSDAMSSYAGLLVIPVFAIIGLNGFSKGGGKEGSKAEGTDIGMTFATIGILAAMVHTVLE